MKNVTLEDILQKNFGLKDTLYKSDGTFSNEGYEAYRRFTAMLGDLSSHVSLHVDATFGKRIASLIDVFDGYDGGGSE